MKTTVILICCYEKEKDLETEPWRDSSNFVACKQCMNEGFPKMSCLPSLLNIHCKHFILYLTSHNVTQAREAYTGIYRSVNSNSMLL